MTDRVSGCPRTPNARNRNGNRPNKNDTGPTGLNNRLSKSDTGRNRPSNKWLKSGNEPTKNDTEPND
jgi:hypothetical protein